MHKVELVYTIVPNGSVKSQIYKRDTTDCEIIVRKSCLLPGRSCQRCWVGWFPSLPVPSHETDCDQVFVEGGTPDATQGESAQEFKACHKGTVDKANAQVSQSPLFQNSV